jgi:hypothetical protein
MNLDRHSPVDFVHVLVKNQQRNNNYVSETIEGTVVSRLKFSTYFYACQLWKA